jgi:hypothetical protein
MKKLALILALMIIPCSAFGLEMLNDNTMDQITGQAGVHIAMDDVQLFINIEKLAWIDCDGIDSPTACTGRPGAIVLNNFQIDVLNINAIVSTTLSDGNSLHTTNQTAAGAPLQLYSVTCGDIPLFYNYGSTLRSGCYLNNATGVNTDGLDNYSRTSTLSVFNASGLTIDVTDRLPALSEGFTNNAAGSAVVGGGVYIGLPTMEIYINAMSFTPVFDGDVNGQTTAAANDDNTTSSIGNAFGIYGDASFGTIYMEGITFSVLGGWLEIAPH